MTSTNNILLVEDNADDRDLTIMVLKDSKIANEIDIAGDGEEALQYFEDQSRPLPALVLLDLKLPKIMGLDVLKRLRADERTKLVPVVVLTSSKEESDRYRSYVEGVNAYVVKPVEFDASSEAVKALGLFWLVINEPRRPIRRARDERTTNRRSAPSWANRRIATFFLHPVKRRVNVAVERKQRDKLSPPVEPTATTTTTRG